MIRRLVGGLGELLITAGVLVLLFVGWQLWWTDVVADRQQEQIVRALTDDFLDGGDGGAGTVGSDAFPDLGQDRAFAIVRIPRFGADYAQARYARWGHPSADARARALEAVAAEIEARQAAGSPITP